MSMNCSCVRPSPSMTCAQMRSDPIALLQQMQVDTGGLRKSLALSYSYSLIGRCWLTAAIMFRTSLGVPKVRASMSSVEIAHTCRDIFQYTRQEAALCRTILGGLNNCTWPALHICAH